MKLALAIACAVTSSCLLCAFECAKPAQYCENVVPGQVAFIGKTVKLADGTHAQLVIDWVWGPNPGRTHVRVDMLFGMGGGAVFAESASLFVVTQAAPGAPGHYQLSGCKAGFVKPLSHPWSQRFLNALVDRSPADFVIRVIRSDFLNVPGSVEFVETRTGTTFSKPLEFGNLKDPFPRAIFPAVAAGPYRMVVRFEDGVRYAEDLWVPPGSCGEASVLVGKPVTGAKPR